MFRAGYAQNELRHGNALVPGIYHYVKMRCDSATAQAATAAPTLPAGASGVTFPAARAATTRLNPAATRTACHHRGPGIDAADAHRRTPGRPIGGDQG